MPVLLLSADLMTTSQVAGAAARQQVELVAVDNVEKLIEEQAARDAGLVIFDLSLAQLELTSAIDRLRTLPQAPARIIAFGPHVHEARLEAARQAGCDQVLSRGQFHATMDEILSAGGQ